MIRERGLKAETWEAGHLTAWMHSLYSRTQTKHRSLFLQSLHAGIWECNQGCHSNDTFHEQLFFTEPLPKTDSTVKCMSGAAPSQSYLLPNFP